MDVFRVGVSIAMSSNASGVLSVIQRDLFGLQRSVDMTTKGMNSLKLAAAGAMAALAGAEALKGMWSLVDAGRELVHQQVLLRAAAIGNAGIAEATTQAWKLAGKVAGTDVTANIKLIADLRNTLGSMDHAVQVSEQMARLGVVLQSVTGKPGEEDAFKFARFLELRGSLIDPKTHQISTERLAAQTQLGQAIIVGERGRVGPADLLAFQQQARGAGSMLSDSGLLNAVPLIQAMGGFRAGTATAAITQSLVGGVMTQRSAKWLQEMGLLPKDAIHVGRGGQVNVDKNRLAGADLLSTDQSAWVTTVLLPALAKKGITNQDAISKAILQSGMRQTATGGLIEYARNAATFAKEVENIRAALGVDQYNVLFGKAGNGDGRRDRDSYGPAERGQIDPTSQMNAFNSAWTNLLTALGGPLVQPAMELVSKLTDVLTDFGQWAAKHPDSVRILGEITAGLAGLAVVLGAFAVGTAAFSGLRVLRGLAGLATAAEAAAPAAAAGSTGLAAAAAAVLPFAPLGAAALGFMAAGTDPRFATVDYTNSVDLRNARQAYRTPIGFGAPTDGYDEQGNPVSYNGPPSKGSNAAVTMTGTINLDGRKVGEFVAKQQARDFALPSNGTTGFDPSMAPAFQGIHF